VFVVVKLPPLSAMYDDLLMKGTISLQPKKKLSFLLEGSSSTTGSNHNIGICEGEVGSCEPTN
jgi:hypothetical protein